MKNPKLLLLSLIILPWLTIPLLGRDAFKKYLPSALFLSVLTKVLDKLGEEKKWWRFYKGIPPFDSMDFFNFGPYFVSSLWVLKMSYGKFPLYLISNLVLNTLFTFFGGVKLANRFKVFSFVKFTKLSYFSMNVMRALLLYGFQYMNDLCYLGKSSFNK